MSIINNDFENIFETGPDARQIGANLTSMTIRNLTVTGTTNLSGSITVGGISLQSSVLAGVGIPAAVIRVVSTLGADMPLVLAPRGNGGISMDIPDAAITGGNARGARAVDFQITRAAATQVASGADSFIAASANSTAAGATSAAISSTTSSVIGGTGSSVISTTSATITNSLISSVIASNNSTTTNCFNCMTSADVGSTFSLSSGSAMISANTCSLTSGNQCLIASSTLSSMTVVDRCTILSGVNVNITANDVCAIGTGITAAAANSFIFSDNSAGIVSPPNANSFTVRATGATAAVFYSNAAATTGVTLAAGASAWAAVSDRNLKENIAEFDPLSAARTISALPIYSYNFIGNPEAQRCIGPMAQDWAEAFPTNKSAKHIDSGDLLGMTISALKYCIAEIDRLKAKN